MPLEHRNQVAKDPRWRNTLLKLVVAAIIGILVYLNIFAIIADDRRKKNPSPSNQHNVFLKILEQSIISSSLRTGEENVDNSVVDPNENEEAGALEKSDELRLQILEDRIKAGSQLLSDFKEKIHAISDAAHSKNTRKTKIDSLEQKKHEVIGQTNEQLQEPRKNLTGLNILLLYADDWTHHTLSSFHKTEPINTILKTPILDALAKDGIRFTHNCVTTSVCWISRATLYTGQYMSRHNTTSPCCWNGVNKSEAKLKEAPSNWKQLSFYELLSKAGYHVGHAGKWGVYLPWPKNVSFNVEDDGWHYRQIGNKMWHITEKNEADALRFLMTRPKDKPFFLNVAFFATHAHDSNKRQYMPQNKSMSMYDQEEIPIPATGTEEAWSKMPYFFGEKNEGRTRWRWRFENYTLHQTMMKNYYRMATEVDTACGMILEELRRQDVLDNTFIIFTTDNGNFHSEHGLADKWYPHQESIRVPLIIYDPRIQDEKRGTTNDAFTLNIDLAPTILGAAGLTVPKEMMGRDISQLYLGHTDPETWRSEFFYEHPIISKASYIPASEALVRKNFKYMYWPDFKFEQLFDLVNDPGELEDIINSTNPEIIATKTEMQRRFTELRDIVRSKEIVTL